MPCLRQSSWTPMPAWASFSTAMICSSVCRLRVMAPSCGAHLSTGELPSQWSSFRGEGQGHRTVNSPFVFRTSTIISRDPSSHFHQYQPGCFVGVVVCGRGACDGLSFDVLVMLGKLGHPWGGFKRVIVDQQCVWGLLSGVTPRNRK